MTSRFAAPRPIPFDFGEARKTNALRLNLSGLAIDGNAAWTVSDEGRTLERFLDTGAGFVFQQQFRLDEFFPGLPAGKEVDLESIDIADGRVWLCGSHSRVRDEPETAGLPNPRFRRRPSRHLFGSIALDGKGGLQTESAVALPFTGRGSLRRKLRPDPYLPPFLTLPGKENGLDIEGMVVLSDRILLGLRGPVIAGLAVILSLPRHQGLPADHGRPHLHMLDLKGLGIRDLARDGSGDGDALFVLAGPVTAADGPFRLYRWQPLPPDGIKEAECLHEWPLGPEHPEGLCPWICDGQSGLLVVYDGPGKTRRSSMGVFADWFAQPASRE